MHGLIAARIEAQACALQDACKTVETFLSFNMAVRMPTLLISGHSPMRLQPAEEHAVTGDGTHGAGVATLAAMQQVEAAQMRAKFTPVWCVR